MRGVARATKRRLEKIPLGGRKKCQDIAEAVAFSGIRKASYHYRTSAIGCGLTLTGIPGKYEQEAGTDSTCYMGLRKEKASKWVMNVKIRKRSYEGILLATRYVHGGMHSDLLTWKQEIYIYRTRNQQTSSLGFRRGQVDPAFLACIK